MLTRRLSPRLLTILSILALLIGASWTMGAETPSPTPSPSASPAASPNASPTASPTASPKGSPAASPSPTPTPPVTLEEPKENYGLGDDLKLRINSTEDQRKLVLFLEGIEIKNLLPISVLDGVSTYRLTPTSDSREAWNNLLAKPADPTKKVQAGVGLAGKTPIGSQEITLRQYDSRLLYVCAVGFLVLLVAFFVAAGKTAILRDSDPPNPEGGPLKRPYSLGKAQMAWWFFIILASFIFIDLVTWNLDTITGSSLVLLGIGAATALGGAMVDSNKRENSNNDLATFEPQKAKLEGLINELNTKIKAATASLAAGADPNLDPTIAALHTELATRQTELQDVNTKVDEAAAGLQKPVSEGPILDLLTDVNGITVHRFQIVVWTLVLSIIFLATVFRTLAMPQFSDTILALMGISAGTFIGFKIPEKQTKPSDAANATGGAKPGAGGAGGGKP